MLVSRRLAAFLLAAGVVQWLIWPTFLRNIAADPRSFDPGPTGFFVVHAVLTAGQLLLATALIGLGWRAWRRAPADRRGTPRAAGRVASPPEDRNSGQG